MVSGCESHFGSVDFGFVFELMLGGGGPFCGASTLRVEGYLESRFISLTRSASLVICETVVVILCIFRTQYRGTLPCLSEHYLSDILQEERSELLTAMRRTLKAKIYRGYKLQLSNKSMGTSSFHHLDCS